MKHRKNYSLLPLLLLSMLNACGQKPDCAQMGPQDPCLNQLRCPSDFVILKGGPLSNQFSQVESVKLVYEFSTDKLFFINTRKYRYHYDFCLNYLGYSRGLSTFNTLEYSDQPGRSYILANLNYYKSSDLYTIEFFADDKVSPDQIRMLLNRVSMRVYFKDNLYLVVKDRISDHIEGIDPARFVSVDKLFGNQKYQPMVSAQSYGYLQKVGKADFDQHHFSSKDIILTDFLPNDLPFCQGIITTRFQTPLSHINILSQNRKTPNCAHKHAWNDANLQNLIGKLVSYEVRQDSFYIREAREKEANAFWNKQNEIPMRKLRCNLKETALLDVQKINKKSVHTVGGKAANFGELEKIALPDHGKIPIPEAAFGIPFYYYQDHITRRQLQSQIDAILNSDSIIQNRTLLYAHLERLQDSIRAKPLDDKFLQLVIAKLKSFPAYTEFRFRSSTNAEDIEGFTGAGLYSSKTGSLTNPNKSVEEAIKKVWASLWTPRAFEERQNAHIDQKSLAMGILVHRAFGTEEINGVAITKDMYREGYPAFTVNAQKGEASVVLPENDEIPEQFLIKYVKYITGKEKTIVDYISHSSLNNYEPLMTPEEIKLLSKYLDAIKKHFYYGANHVVLGEAYFDFAMDIEFKLDKGTRKIYIKQARKYN